MLKKRSSNASFYTVVAIYILAALLNLAWIGTLIWAIIYVVTHLGEWLG